MYNNYYVTLMYPNAEFDHIISLLVQLVCNYGKNGETLPNFNIFGLLAVRKMSAKMIFSKFNETYLVLPVYQILGLSKHFW